MARKTKYPELKTELKALAKEIRYWKRNRKLKERIKRGYDLRDVQWKLMWRKDDFRHRHIAYCMLRGRLHGEIEQPAENNLPDMDEVEKIMEKHSLKKIK